MHYTHTHIYITLYYHVRNISKFYVWHRWKEQGTFQQNHLSHKNSNVYKNQEKRCWYLTYKYSGRVSYNLQTCMARIGGQMSRGSLTIPILHCSLTHPWSRHSKNSFQQHKRYRNTPSGSSVTSYVSSLIGSSRSHWFHGFTVAHGVLEKTPIYFDDGTGTALLWVCHQPLHEWGGWLQNPALPSGLGWNMLKP